MAIRSQNAVRLDAVLKAPAIYKRINWVKKYSPDKAILRGYSYVVAKRIFDLSLIFVALPILIPLFLIIMLILKHEYPEREVFFKQLRTGKGGKRFWMYKFSTMVPNAEELKASLQHLNVLKWPDFKIPNDPRVTRIGKILRRTSLDEFPQLINVLRGEMSIVGPRPTSFASKEYKIWQTEKLEVAPGLTGLWQITARAKTEFNDRLILDIAYIRHRCFMLDMEILLRTIPVLLKETGA